MQIRRVSGDHTEQRTPKNAQKAASIWCTSHSFTFHQLDHCNLRKSISALPYLTGGTCPLLLSCSLAKGLAGLQGQLLSSPYHYQNSFWLNLEDKRRVFTMLSRHQSQCRTLLCWFWDIQQVMDCFLGCSSTFLTGASLRGFRLGMGMSGRWKEEANEKKQLRNSKEMKKVLCLSLLQMGPFHLKKKHLRNNFKILSQNSQDQQTSVRGNLSLSFETLELYFYCV